jgi:uncharacterized protein YdeI (YjbR/CyaY-like superfamily)
MEYTEKDGRWKDEMAELRRIASDSGLTETVKWGKQAYCYDGRTVLILQNFKNNCCMLFIKGEEVSDPDGLLRRSSFSVNGGRRLEFTSTDEINAIVPGIKKLIESAKSVRHAV